MVRDVTPERFQNIPLFSCHLRCYDLNSKAKIMFSILIFGDVPKLLKKFGGSIDQDVHEKKNRKNIC